MNVLIKTLFLATFTIWLTSCNYTNKVLHKSYEDNAEDFLITGNGRQIALLGEKYHYVIDDNSQLLSGILSWDTKKILYIDFRNSHLEADRNNDIKGSIVIRTVFTSVRPEDSVFLNSRGFKYDEEGNLYLKSNIRGKRFLPRPGADYRGYPLNQRYYFEVEVEPNAGEEALRAIAVPFTFTLDVIIWFGRNILLAPFGIRD